MAITIKEYDPAWKKSFQELKAVYETFLDKLIIDIQHVGSTSVEGLAAKPVIDIDLIVEDGASVNPVIQKLDKLGYDHLGDLGIVDRQAFRRRSESTPLNGSARNWPAHNLYVCPKDSISLKNHLQFRDYLRINPGKAKEYGELKKQIVSENPEDLDLYIERKTPFIINALRESGFNKDALNDITQANKAK